MRSQTKRIILYIVIAAIIVIVGSVAILFAPKSAPASAQEHIDLGNTYLIELSYDKAVIEFTEAIEIEPLNADAYLGLAEAYVGLGDTEKAVEVLKAGYDKTGDERLKAMLEKLLPNEETVAITTSITANATVTELLRETETSNAEANISEEALKYSDMINSINDSSEISVICNTKASNFVVNNTDLLYIPEHFNSDIIEMEEYISYQYYHLTNNNLIELIYPYGRKITNASRGDYLLIKSSVDRYPFNLIERDFLINKIFNMSDNEIYFENIPGSGRIFNVFPFVFLENFNMQYGLVIDINNKKYTVYGDGSEYIDYLCGENFKGFYKKYISNDFVSYDFWTDINENSYTYYSIHNGSVNGKGNFIIDKFIVTSKYPEDFDASLWDKIHEIDEVKSVITNIGG